MQRLEHPGLKGPRIIPMKPYKPVAKRFTQGPPRRENLESFWFLVIVLMGFIALIALSISKAVKFGQ